MKFKSYKLLNIKFKKDLSIKTILNCTKPYKVVNSRLLLNTDDPSKKHSQIL